MTKETPRGSSIKRNLGEAVEVGIRNLSRGYRLKAPWKFRREKEGRRRSSIQEGKKRLSGTATKNGTTWWLGHLLRLTEQGCSVKSLQKGKSLEESLEQK